jgi:hypothetical protein
MSNVDFLLDRLSGDPAYIRFLIAERPYIRAALEARGYNYSAESRTESYPASIGNALHLDLLMLEDWLKTLSPQDRKLLQEWSETVMSAPAFSYPKIGRVRHLVREFARATQAT